MVKQPLYKLLRSFTWHLVHHHRKRLGNTVFISITGSSGKTTAKDLVYEILSTKYRGTRSYFTRNGLSAHCRAVLKTMPWHRFCVLEVASGTPNAIARAVALVPPDMGVMLTIGLEHFSAMRSRENTAVAKEMIVTGLSMNGVAFINTDDPLVEAMTERVGARVVRFGCGEKADIRASQVASVWPERLSFTVSVSDRDYSVKTHLCGAQWLTSILAAISIGIEMKVPMPDIQRAVEKFEPIAGRMSPVEMADGVTYLRDDWKAPYWSIHQVMDYMKQARAQRRIIVMGTISDYAGSASPKYRKVAANALDSAELVIFTGPNASYAVKNGQPSSDPRLILLPDFHDLENYLKENLKPGDLVLLKGSGKTDRLDRLITNHRNRIAASN